MVLESGCFSKFSIVYLKTAENTVNMPKRVIDFSYFVVTPSVMNVET